MSKLPKRPDIENHRARIGLDQYDGLWITIDDELRQLATPLGLQLNPSDFSDLYLPTLQFVDEGSNIHEMSINKEKQLLIDDVAVFNLSNFYTKKEVDELQVLKSPNGTKFKIGVHDDGTLYSQKI
ncbi:hypothetical protein [Weissella minor]|uniref:hypothetical protein n=1 Tax=Weissella minor TaxID=1620 RepID=UPI003AF26BC7